MTLQLRPYQLEAIESVFTTFHEYDSAILVQATGTGKTCVAAKVCERFRPEGRILFLAHREELLKQAQEKLQQWTTLKTGIEQAEKTVAGLWLPDVTIASVQTLSQPRRLEKFAPDTFGLIICDECHRSTASTYQLIFRYFHTAKRLGLTATADRTDGKAMGAVYNAVAYTYEIRDAIEQGFLVPIRQQAVEVHSLDLSKVRTTAGDLNEGDLETILLEERNLHEVAQPTVELAKDRPTLLFCSTVKHSHALAEVINRYKPESASAIDGSFDSARRIHTLNQFKNGDIQFLANCDLLTEGIDIPQVACVAMARPTKSRIRYCQAVGRGTRLYPPDKKDLLILDYVGNSGRHSLISALDILDGNTDLAVKARAQTLSKKNPKLTILQALEQASEELATEQRQTVLAKAKFHTVEVDPFTVLGVHPRAGRWGGQAISDKQIAILDKAGIPWSRLDKGQASEVIDKIFNRREQGLCTVKMAKALMKYGLNPDVSFEVASKQLNAIAQSGWKLTLAQHEQIAKLAA